MIGDLSSNFETKAWRFLEIFSHSFREIFEENNFWARKDISDPALVSWGFLNEPFKIKKWNFLNMGNLRLISNTHIWARGWWQLRTLHNLSKWFINDLYVRLGCHSSFQLISYHIKHLQKILDVMSKNHVKAQNIWL